MAKHHDSVDYIEPNVVFGSDISIDGVEYNTTHDLDEYCTSLTIEMEVYSRNDGVLATSQENRVLKLSWNDTKSSTVNFMSGVKMKDSGFQYMTTDYADMHLLDIESYGTVEMMGIKSLSIEYESAVVPVINAVFTDVRGMALFNQVEIARKKGASGLGSVTKENVAESFFCGFFMMPLPLFTITLKGFYGKPVSYQVMCDKFETDFNPEEGSFDIKTRFIGTKYSFLSDVSLDMLIAAPYCDYLGQAYWDSNVSNGRFTLPGGVSMPTLYDIVKAFKDLALESDKEDLPTYITNEDMYDTTEVTELQGYITAYKEWFVTLYDTLRGKYTNDRLFKVSDNCIVLLMPNKPMSDAVPNVETIADELGFDSIPASAFTAVNNVNASIKSYNEKYGANVSEFSTDFATRKKQKLFNASYDNGGRVQEITLDDSSYLSESTRVAISTSMLAGDNRNILNRQIFGFSYGIIFECDTSNIQVRIDSITSSKSTNETANEIVDRIQTEAYNRRMESAFGWHPSISNFTKIVMAHLETFMHMMYEVVTQIDGGRGERTPSALGVTVGEGGNCSDVKKDNADGGSGAYVPPFPRVTKQVDDPLGGTRMEDTWVGEFTGSGSSGFIEKDLVNTFFNGIQYILTQKALDDNIRQFEEANNGITKTSNVMFPLSHLDFFLKGNVYPENCIDTYYKFLYAVLTRMYYLVKINGIRYDSSDSAKAFRESHFDMGFIEAKNFFENVKPKSQELRDWIGDKGRFADWAEIKKLMTCEPEYDSSKNGFKTEEDEKNFSEIPWIIKYNVGEDTIIRGMFTSWGAYHLYTEYDVKSDFDGCHPIYNLSPDRVQESFNRVDQYNYKQDDGMLILEFTKGPSAHANFTLSEVSSGPTEYFNSLFILDTKTKCDNVAKTLELSSSFTVGGESEKYEPFRNYLYNDFAYNANNYKECFDGCNKIGSKANSLYLCPGLDVVSDDMIEYEWSGISDRVSNVDVPFKYCSTLEYICADGEKNSEERYLEELDSSQGEPYEVFFDTQAEYGMLNGRTYFLSEVFDFTGKGGVKVASVLENRYEEIFNNGDIYESAYYFILGVCVRNIEHSEKFGEILGKYGFKRLPNFVVLKIGAILWYLRNNNGNFYKLWGDDFEKEVRENISYALTPYASYLKSQTVFEKMTYIKYFMSWAEKNIGEIRANLNPTKQKGKGRAIVAKCENTRIDSKFNKTKYVRYLFNWQNEYIKTLSNDLFKSVVLVQYYYGYVSLQDQGSSTFGAYESYLNGFRKGLCDLLDVEYNDLSNTTVSMSDPSDIVTDEMRMELYRYLKQIYDKWIPTSKFDEWKFENFFSEGSSNYKFYFIDSYFNNIADKLIVNPQKLSEELDASLNAHDTNTMVYSLLSRVYSDNRCMLRCVQNFIDITDNDNMKMMFTPLSYNEAFSETRKRGTDFVVVYTYEPSKNLAIDGGEYLNDGFMLNDEQYTPIQIRSRGSYDKSAANKPFYKIPAFGVAYGKQYQSFFTSVNVNMSSPIQTQQAIRAKHAILNSNSNKNARGGVGQDMFDVYSTQSYTCNVKMMGCAWVQPMMYFVLLNIPMFKGSYLINKVTHNISQGVMTTEFSGVRMANVSNKLVDKAFTDDSISSGGYSDIYRLQNLNADITNDCPYKVFPIFGDGGIVDDEELNRTIGVDDCGKGAYQYVSGRTILDVLQRITDHECSATLSEQRMLHAAVLRNRYCMKNNWKSIFDVVQFEAIKHINTTTTYQETREIIRDTFVLGKWRNSGSHKQTIISTGSKSLAYSGRTNEERHVEVPFDNIGHYSQKGMRFSPRDIDHEDIGRIIFTPNYDEIADKVYLKKDNVKGLCDKPVYYCCDANKDGDKGHVFTGDKDGRLYYDPSKVGQTNVMDKGNSTQELFEAFYNAINKTAQETPNIRVTLQMKNEIGKDDKNSINTNDIRFFSIFDSSGPKSKLAKVFDFILNEDGYFNHIRELYWVYDNHAHQVQSDPVAIGVRGVIKEGVKLLEHKVYMVPGTEDLIGHINIENPITEECNDGLRMALSKFNNRIGNLAKVKEIVPQLASGNRSDDEIRKVLSSNINDCTQVMSGAHVVAVRNIPKLYDPETKQIGDWDFKSTEEWIMARARSNSQAGCDEYGAGKKAGPYTTNPERPPAWDRQNMYGNVPSGDQDKNQPQGEDCKHRCLAYVKRALAAGGFPFDGTTKYAADFGPWLLSHGFGPVLQGSMRDINHRMTGALAKEEITSDEKGRLCPGDVIIIRYAPTAQPGHALIALPGKFVSDYVQEYGMWGQHTTSYFVVYRYTGERGGIVKTLNYPTHK